MNLCRLFRHNVNIKKAANLLAAIFSETILFLVNLIIVNLHWNASNFLTASNKILGAIK